ncbi:hypothetical protein DM992_34170 [Burkholderia sp. JP2-270]|uniref:hypothetical protein n=1 Tax=Burkholderia sp. JP2-270 TaxID=2217913 RepID=UPI000DA40AB5|nr:hypothetical protein [Burkholderia sp. JP2-270]AWV04443.1 hypothetical protein DM992_34170 [Burkholderia sp. JP2-270]
MQLNQGNKSFAHRSAPLETHDRRVLPGLHGTICGAIPAGARRADRRDRAKRQRAARAHPPYDPAVRRARRAASIVRAFTQQKLPD